MDLHDCPCSGKTLARLVQPAVMALLAEQPLHGYLIVQRLGAMRMFQGQTPDPTGVYRVLKSMEQEGLVEPSWHLADSGPAKRSFALTARGRECLAQWVQTLENYQQSISGILASMEQAMGRKSGTGRKGSRRKCKCGPASDCCGNASSN